MNFRLDGVHSRLGLLSLRGFYYGTLIALATDDGCAILGNLDTRIQGLALVHLGAVGQTTPNSVLQQELFWNSQAQLSVNLRAGGGDIGADQNSHNAQRFSQIIHNSLQAVSLSCILSQNPGSGFIDIFIGTANQSPNSLDSSVNFHIIHSLGISSYGFSYKALQLVVDRLASSSILDNAAMIFFNHGHSAVQQVAQIVSQIGINASNQRITGEVAVAAQIDFAQQEITNGVSAEFIN